MHDIGKVGIKDSILMKPGKLTPDEFDEIRLHTIYGADVLRTAESNVAKHKRSLFKTGIDIAEGHHEKWNGTGYPHKRAGDEIPLSARIVAIADVFDAMTSERPYKKAFTFDESFAYLVEQSGVQFDPAIIDACFRHKEELFVLYNQLER
jgi:HD-GYP domain-containing protein (c-di-GMP phosphodiesterase class II)